MLLKRRGRDWFLHETTTSAEQQAATWIGGILTQKCVHEYEEPIVEACHKLIERMNSCITIREGMAGGPRPEDFQIEWSKQYNRYRFIGYDPESGKRTGNTL